MSDSPETPPKPTEPVITEAAPKAVAAPAAQPYRVQGVHVAEFAARRANRSRTIAFMAAAGGLVMALLLLSSIIHAGSFDEENVIEHNGVPLALLAGAIIIGHRNFVRSRLLQTIAEAAQREPVAVWGVKDEWLYPLDPKASRAKLSVTLDVAEHHDIYKKPRAPIAEPREPLP